MSFLIELKNAEHTFCNWAKNEVTKILGEAPTFLQIADTTLAYAGPVLVTLLQPIAGSAVSGEVQSVISESIQDITVVRAVITDAGPTPSAASMIASIQNNLAAALTAGHITNPASVALVNKVLKEFAALLANFPQPTPSAT